MPVRVIGAREHNLQDVKAEFGDGLSVVTGVSGSGKTSLVFDTLYHEARRRFLEIFSVGASAARLAPANVEVIEGLGPAIAVGQNLLNRNPNSILATAAGLHPFLRMLFANFSRRTCPRCGAGLTVLSEDEIVETAAGLAQSGDLEISVPLLLNVPGSHRTLLDALAEEFSPANILVDGAPWNGQALNAVQPHSVEVRVGRVQTKMPQELPGLIRALVQAAAGLGGSTLRLAGRKESLLVARAPVCVECGAWFGELRAVDYNRACPHCAGQGCAVCFQTGLPPAAASARWAGLNFPELLALSVDETLARFQTASLGAPAARLQMEIERRLEALRRVGLGYVALNRPSPTLSRGEAQRVRLALALISRLEDMLHILDEPTVGQHPADVANLLPAFRDLAGPVIFVEHDRTAAAGADRAIDLGPGAGQFGGHVVYAGTPAGLWQADTTTGRFFSLRERPPLRREQPAPQAFLTVRAADLRNLRGIDVPFPLGRLTVVTGVSGSGKSTLVEDVLVASLSEGKALGCAGIDGPAFKPVMVDQSPIGRNPRSNPATYTKLADVLRDLYAARTGLPASSFSFNRPEGACPTCQGLGAVEVSMRYLPPTWVPCEDCLGQRFCDAVLAARMTCADGIERSIADFLGLTISTVRPLLEADTQLPQADRKSALRILQALEDIGLGYLTLGQPSPTLSGGEAQRVKLARYLGQRSLAGQLLVLDEPSTGLHPQDLAGLLTVLDRLVQAGATIVVVEHNLDILRAADWVVDLGPGAGPKGGRLIYAGPPEGLTEVEESLTGKALKEEEHPHPASPTLAKPSGWEEQSRGAIRIRGARAHNLRNVDVNIPKGCLTVVTGVSGSGKSSLVGDVLEAEARRRFLETLSLYERQGIQEGPEAEVESVGGLGVALTITPERVGYSRRATVGTATELIHHLAVLMATAGERICRQCGTRMLRCCPTCGEKAEAAKPQHFTFSSYASACLKCHGVGTLQIPQPNKLIIHPDKPLVAGAMYSPGFFPNGYLGKPFNHGYYTILALGARFGFDPQRTPWNQMGAEAQQAFLYGSDAALEITVETRKGKTFTREGHWGGFYHLIGEWDVGGTYTDTTACPACGGARLRPEFLAVQLGGFNISQLSQMALVELAAVLENLILMEGVEHLAAGSLTTARRRLRFLKQVGLGYLHLNREAGTLSAGEIQRIRLAGLLGSGLTSLTLLLDEPTRGLHPAEVDALLVALRELRGEGNTVIVVEHDPQIMHAADHLIDMGPGAGQAGGRVVAQGTPAEVEQSASLTGTWLRGERRPAVRLPRREPGRRWLVVEGARANNLQNVEARFPLGLLVGVCGVSGSGKSTLVMDTLGRVLAPRKQTTSVAYEPVAPGAHKRITGTPPRALMVDQSKAGVGSPAAYLDLADPLRVLFAGAPEAYALGLTADHLAGRCSACGGSGVLTLDMSFLPDVRVPCEVCRGTGALPEAWNVHLRDIAYPEVFGLTIDEVYDLFGAEERLARPLQAARDVGLGYLVLRQPGYALSGGEAQRLKIAQELCRKTLPGTLYILDEPSVGQHLEDVARLAGVLHRLVDEGGSVLVVEHHAHLLAACDWLVELGPGGGPQGGWIVAVGPPENVAQGATPTAPYLREVLEGLR